MILLALGSNLGVCELTLQRARDALIACGVAIVAVASLRETSALMPEGAPADWDLTFMNPGRQVKTALVPFDPLGRVKAVEAQLGRRPASRLAPRDVDILAHGDHVLAIEALVLRQAQMHLRRFVLGPLCEIARQWRHPLLGRTAAQLLAALPAESST